jgi:hypothetical protein
MVLLVRSKTFKPKNARLISIVCSLLFLTGCGGDSADLDRATKAVPPNEDLDYWSLVDETDDFGDRFIQLVTYSENGVGPSKSVPYGDNLELSVACFGGDYTLDEKFIIAVAVKKNTDLKVIGSPKSVDIRFDGGNPTNIPVYTMGSRVVHLENASKYVSKILNASTFSVRFVAAQDRNYAGTFQVQGFSKYLSNFKSAGCFLGG